MSSEYIDASTGQKKYKREIFISNHETTCKIVRWKKNTLSHLQKNGVYMLENFKTSNHRGEWLISSIWKSSAMECQEEIPPIKIVVKAPHDSRNMPCEEVLNIKEKLGCTKCPGDLATSSDELVQCQITKCG